MNRFYTKFLLLLLAPLSLLMGCEEDDKITDTTPSIVFSTSRSSLESIDLDKGTGPQIRGWAVAPAGLAQVTITADKVGGGEEILNVTTFSEENSEKGGTAFQFVVLPSYTPEFTGITVSVVDKNEQTEQLNLDVAAIGGTAGPTLADLPAGPIEANIRESVNLRPEITGTISSHWGLASVTFIEMYGEEEEVIEVVSDFGDTPNTFQVNVTPDYDKGFAEGMTGFKIVAEDKKGNSSTYEVSISVIDAAPAPVVTFDQEMIVADLTSSPQIKPAMSGIVESVEGLASVKFFVDGPGADEQLGDEVVSFEDEKSYSFSFDDFPYALGVKGLKVVAVDVSGQTTTDTLPVTVVAEDPDLLVHHNIISNAQGDRHDAGVVTAISSRDGETYTLAEGLDPALSSTIDFITADSGGDNKLDLFSPAGNSWLTGNYFKKDVNGDMIWPVLNETRMRILGEGEVDFSTATSLDIAALELGVYKLRLEELQVGGVALFVTSEGKKGLILYEASDNAEGKTDKFTFDIKVLK